MGANVSTVSVVNKAINENKSTLDCKADAQAWQTTNLTGDGVFNISDDCEVRFENELSMKSDCDISGIIATLSSQDMMAELKQTAAAGLAANSSRVKQQNIVNNINDMAQKCSSPMQAHQEFTSNINEMNCKDRGKVIMGNTGSVETNCLLSAAQKIDSQQSSKTKISQTVESLLGPLLALIVGAIVIFAAVFLFPGLMSFKILGPIAGLIVSALLIYFEFYTAGIIVGLITVVFIMFIMMKKSKKTTAQTVLSEKFAKLQEQLMEKSIVNKEE